MRTQKLSSRTLLLSTAAAVAAILVPVAVLAGTGVSTETAPSGEVASTAAERPGPTETDRSEPSPAPFTAAAYDDWRTSIPQEVTVSHGLPDADADVTRTSKPIRFEFCDSPAFPRDGAIDSRRAGATGPEYGDARDLRLFADDRTAHRFLSAARQVAADCPEDEHGVTLWINDVVPTSLGEESIRIVETFETDGMTNAGANIWNVVRVGNAVLVTAHGGEYLPGDSLGPGIQRNQRLVAPIIESMCVFSADGRSCAS